MTAQQIIEKILKSLNPQPRDATVDTIKAGSGTGEVTGINVTIACTLEVVEKAMETGANFIITHEPTFYTHEDDTMVVMDNATFKKKLDLINKNEITVWRMHDCIHGSEPDLIIEGNLKRLEWLGYQDPDRKYIINLPGTTVGKVAEHLKQKLSIKMLRLVGDPDQSCSSIVFTPGAIGGGRQMAMAEESNADLLICGEIAEWEAPEYMRDTVHSGQKRALLVIGHWKGEEPGMEHVSEWISKLFPDIKTQYIPVDDAFVHL